MHTVSFYCSLLLSILIFACSQEKSTQEAVVDPPNQRAYSLQEQAIFDALKAKDSLLFNLCFNTCDTTALRTLLDDDFVFYHDQSGITDSKAAFVSSIPNLCKMDYKASRTLEEASLEIFPMYNQGELYGAIQKGEHHFWGKKGEASKYLTSSAKFSHLWLLKEGEWYLSTVFSYHHHSPEE